MCIYVFFFCRSGIASQHAVLELAVGASIIPTIVNRILPNYVWGFDAKYSEGFSAAFVVVCCLSAPKGRWLPAPQKQNKCRLLLCDILAAKPQTQRIQQSGRLNLSLPEWGRITKRSGRASFKVMAGQCFFPCSLFVCSFKKWVQERAWQALVFYQYFQTHTCSLWPEYYFISGNPKEKEPPIQPV